MDDRKLLEALVNGEKVRACGVDSWGEGEYVHMPENIIVDELGNQHNLETGFEYEIVTPDTYETLEEVFVALAADKKIKPDKSNVKYICLDSSKGVVDNEGGIFILNSEVLPCVEILG